MCTLVSGVVSAAGFEKALLWSGRYAGMGGAVASSVSGSESMMFNPAGLVSTQGIDVSANFSPTSTQTKAPLSFYTNSSLVTSSKRSLRFPFGLTGKYSVNPDLAVGAGFMVSGGAGADFGDLVATTINGVTVPVPYQSKIAISEFALGAAYKVMPGLKVGATWRTSFVSARFQYGQVSGASTVLGADLNGLKATNFAGFRLGAQYEPEGMPVTFGVFVRTPVSFTAKGTLSAFSGANAAVTTLTGSETTVKNSLPLQIGIGAHYKVMAENTVALQYELTNYSANKVLDFSGTVTGVAVLPVDIVQNWKNMHAVRLGYEHGFGPAVVRAGYIFTTAVTPKEYAQPTFSSPGPGHTFVVGGGYSIDKSLRADGALEYSMASGTVTSTLNSQKTGKYSSNAFGAHLGLTYTL